MQCTVAEGQGWCAGGSGHEPVRSALTRAWTHARVLTCVSCVQAKRAFCAVRPPGHHAGPSGIVPGRPSMAGSHGFCLLNNVAIGAAYAVSTYRHVRIRRVALLDFDVHHGNGTEECVFSTVPHETARTINTPFSVGMETFQQWRPWFDGDDRRNILFASVQGYGPRSGRGTDFVYPGSGATSDNRGVVHPLAVRPPSRVMHCCCYSAQGDVQQRCGTAVTRSAWTGTLVGTPAARRAVAHTMRTSNTAVTHAAAAVCMAVAACSLACSINSMHSWKDGCNSAHPFHAFLVVGSSPASWRSR